MGEPVAYDNTTRESAARANRSRILRAATESFLQHGYAATTVRSVAAAAGLSQESVYKIYGGKAGLLKAVYDRSVAGDDAPVPFAAREHVRAVRAAANPAAAAAAWSAMVIAIGARTDPLVSVLMAARESDSAIADLLDAVDEERLTGARMAVQHWDRLGWLRQGIEPEDAAVTLWTLNSAQIRILLARRGWNDEQYARWLAGLLRTSVLVTEHATPPVRHP